MSATASNGATSQQQDTVPARTFWSMVILIMVLLGLLGVGVVLYLTWRHPSLEAPFTVACAALAILVSTALALARR